MLDQLQYQVFDPGRVLVFDLKIEVIEQWRQRPASAVESGTKISGPAADRLLLTQHLPLYPDWAMREGIEASVRLHFWIRRDGSVKENILVQKTSGFLDFDRAAQNALGAWRFAALAKHEAGEQWGTITFNFHLKNAR